MAKQVAKIYGEALFDLAMEQNKPDAYLEEVLGIGKILEENPEFDKLMKHPKISKAEKQEIVGNVFSGSVSKEMTGFLKLVVSKERYRDINSIFSYFVDRVKEEKKIGVAYVTTAIPLSAGKKAEVEQKLLQTTPYKKMEMHYSVDEDIIGGMIIRIKDRVVDSSVRTKLLEMKKQLSQIQLGELIERKV
ncbi:MAG: F0F1 ATP synthase subunit delta [Lachnospiraceae bacterium]|nr:F0F1 ATP synthase subunit delta [Lachnospiraceae bacterium]